MTPSRFHNRRTFMTVTAGTLAAACFGRVGPAAAADTDRSNETSQGRNHSTVPIQFLLVHGAWHGAGHWAQLSAALTRRGHDVRAVDLPGHGMSARFPASYFEAGQKTLAHDVSPIGKVTLDVAAESVVAELEALRRGQGGGRRHTVLVAHSMGGAVATRAVQRASELVDHVVYVSAFVPTLLGTAGAYLALPEASGASGAGLYLGDPAETGAVRINPRSTDPAYLEELRATYYTGVPTAAFLAYAHALTPEQPLGFLTGEAGATADRWGAVPRTFVRCLRDRALPLPLQDRLIDDADRLTPGNRFRQATLDSGHAPFASLPGELADVLVRTSG
ncbi:alpha/beta hydrolase [Streptomyces antimycoticus]|uniref:alpha/beta hydrolase n=1 Tax=Streptomyces antimycoticus TaxID=68175 RepID=UPI003870EA0C|nr:alpha/beta fold hydrolase [Streptomyces antimycoticus]